VMFVLIFLCLCASFTVVPYAVGTLSLGHDSDVIEAWSFGGMVVAGFSLLTLHALKIAVTASGM
jgi:hypothetical protein